MGYGMIFGTGIGLLLGKVSGGVHGTGIDLSLGTGIEMVFGMMYGERKDDEAKKQGRVL